MLSLKFPQIKSEFLKKLFKNREDLGVLFILTGLARKTLPRIALRKALVETDENSNITASLVQLLT